MAGNLAARRPLAIAPNRGDLYAATRIARRSADARICRCAGVARRHIYTLACISPTLEAIANLALSFLLGTRRSAESEWLGKRTSHRYGAL
jgi:hypothetical protein